MNRQGDLFHYPNRPGFKQYGTSQEAADAIEPQAHTLRGKALAEIKAAGRHGLTADEVADQLGRSVLSIRPRVSELLVLGLIERNRQRRKNTSGLFADAYVEVSRETSRYW
jgi:predicted transcriptional regulator